MLVWLISLSLGLVAIAQMIVLSATLFSDSLDIAGAAVRSILSPYDIAILYGSAVMLLAATYYLFRMRHRSVWLLISYVGLGSWIALGYAVTASPGFEFNALASLMGFIPIVLVLGYAISLKARGTLA